VNTFGGFVASFFASRAFRAASANDSCCGAAGCVVAVLAAPLEGVAFDCPDVCDWLSCEGLGSADWHHPLAGIAKIAAAAAHGKILRMATPPGAR
jgi:hypothetical protein